MESSPNISTLRPNEARRIGHIIGTSFADDPVNMWVFGGNKGLVPFYTREAEAYLRHGFCHVNKDSTAGTLWLSPGKSKDLPTLKRLGMLGSILKHSGPGALKRGLAIETAMKDKTPKIPHYYLFAIGTLPESQGSGQGSAIMNHALKQIDAEGMPAYLENSKPGNIPFYRRFGFEILEEIRVTADAPPLFAMLRKPKPSKVY